MRLNSMAMKRKHLNTAFCGTIRANSDFGLAARLNWLAPLLHTVAPLSSLYPIAGESGSASSQTVRNWDSVAIVAGSCSNGLE